MPPHNVPEKKWQPFIATTMSAAKWLVLRPVELKTTVVSTPLTTDSNGGSGRRDAVITVEDPQKLTPVAVLSSLPSIGVMLDNGGTENRRGVAHARLPEKSVQNCDATVVTGHIAGLDKNEARWVGDRGQPSDEQNAVLSGWHDARARSG